jgi:hypothetical protein
MAASSEAVPAARARASANRCSRPAKGTTLRARGETAVIPPPCVQARSEDACVCHGSATHHSERGAWSRDDQSRWAWAVAHSQIAASGSCSVFPRSVRAYVTC